MPLNGLPPYGILGYNIVLDTGVGLANRDSSATLVATTTGFSLTGDAVLSGLRTAPGTTSSLITGATTLVLADSGGVFTIAQTSAYDIAVPDPTTGGGCVYKFVVTTAGAFNVTISTTGASTFVGTIINDVTSVIPATGSTLTIASGVAAIGDTITITSLSLGLYLVEAVTSANGGITIA